MIWIRIGDLAGITRYGGISIWRTVVALDSGMEVVMVIKTDSRLKRNVRVLVLNRLKKVTQFIGNIPSGTI